jgi:hypothetical protein
MTSNFQKLTLYYDTLFNRKYDKINSLDKQIDTNEDLILTNINEYSKQMNQNNSLKVILFASFLILIVIILYHYNLIPSPMILIIIIIAVIVLAMLIIYFNYYKNDYVDYLERINRETNQSFEKVNKPVGNELNCDFEEEEGILFDKSKLANNKQNYNYLLKTTSNYDVWKNGDHITSSSPNENTRQIVDQNWNASKPPNKDSDYDKRSPFNSLADSATTYYDCEYTGANMKNVPFNMKYMKSTVPCNYYVNYKQTGKFKKSCDNYEPIT